MLSDSKHTSLRTDCLALMMGLGYTTPHCFKYACYLCEVLFCATPEKGLHSSPLKGKLFLSHWDRASNRSAYCNDLFALTVALLVLCTELLFFPTTETKTLLELFAWIAFAIAPTIAF